MPLINTRGAASVKGFGFAGFSPTVPGVPTSVSATATAYNSASVSFTAPACNGGLTIDYYQAISTPGCFTATGTSPISITGLSASTSYTFKVRAHNSLGYGSYSSCSSSITTPIQPGSQSYTSSGCYTFTTPAGVSSISVVAVGGGGAGGRGWPYNEWGGSGGGGGGLGYKNNQSVSPGCSYTVTVGAGGISHQYSCPWPGSSSKISVGGSCVAVGNGGGGGYFGTQGSTGGGGGHSGTGGGNGGQGALGCYLCSCRTGGGGGGAAGYSGNGGCGGMPNKHPVSPSSGSGGGGGGGTAGSNQKCTAGGGGVGILGQGSNGAAGYCGSTYGRGGSGGGNGAINGTKNCFGGPGGSYGGGGGASSAFCNASYAGNGAGGAVRIVWPGTSRQYPSTCVGSP